MGFFSKLLSGTPTLPDECSRQICETAGKAIDRAVKWKRGASFIITPSDAMRNVEYTKPTGLRIFWWSDDGLFDPGLMVIDDYIKYHFHDTKDCRSGLTGMVFYSPLPSKSIGKEAAYISYISQQLKKDYPFIKLSFGSNGRMLTVHFFSSDFTY